MALAKFQERIREYISGGVTEVEQLRGDEPLINLAFNCFDEALKNARGKGVETKEYLILKKVATVMSFRQPKKDGQKGENVVK